MEAAMMRNLVVMRCSVSAAGLMPQNVRSFRILASVFQSINHTIDGVPVRKDDAGDKTEAVGLQGGAAGSAAGAVVKPMEELNGPIGWPVVGNFLTYLRKENRGKMHEVQARLHKRYGKIFREKWGSNWQVHVCDPQMIEEIHRKEGRYPNRPSLQPWLLYRQLTGLPHGITTSQGSEWQLFRNEFGKRLFCPHATKSLIEPINAVGNDLIQKLVDTRDSEGESAVADHMPNILYLWSLEAAGTFLFETRLGCLERTIPQRTQQFIDSLMDVMTSTLYLIVGEKVHQKLNTPYWQRHRTAWDKIFEIGKELIDEKIKALSNPQSAAKKSGLYLTHLLSNKNVSLDQIYTNLTELLIAGSDTTANSFCFITYLLANNREVQQKLYNEITDVLQGEEDITSAHLENMKYLKCVIKEGMRLYPVATMNCRILEEDIVLNEHLIPKKTLFVLNLYASGMDSEVFPNAEKFLPERWFRDGNESSRRHPFACLPFGFGNRSCVGKIVGKMELMVALTKLIRRFELQPIPGEKLNPVLRTLLTPGDRVPVRLVDRV